MVHVILSLRSQMTSARLTRSSDSVSPRNRHPLTHAALPPSRLEHRISCAARSLRAPSHRICTMICMVDVWSCALGVRRQSVGLGHERSYLRTQVIEFRLSVLHVVRLAVLTQCHHSHRFSHSTYCHILVVFRSAHPVTVLRFQFAWTCLPRSLLLPSKSWGCSRHLTRDPVLSSVCNLIDCVNLHGRVHATLDGTLTNRSSPYTFPSSLSIDFSFFFLFMMYASSFLSEQVVPSLDDV